MITVIIIGISRYFRKFFFLYPFLFILLYYYFFFGVGAPL